MTIQVGSVFPEVEKLPFEVAADNPFAVVDLKKEYAGKWLMLFSVPFAFTGLCQNELDEYNKLFDEFAARECAMVGFSCDSQFAQAEWVKGIADFKVRMVADYNKGLTTAFGISSALGSAQRATFLIDPNGKVRFAMVTDLVTGRNCEETLRVLDALQTGGFTACGWKKGDKALG